MHEHRQITELRFCVADSKLIPPTPQFLKQPVDTVAVVGDAIVLECAADSAIAYYWFRDGIQVKDLLILGIGNLKFPSVKTTDASKYYCQASNKGINNTKKATLTVHGKDL